MYLTEVKAICYLNEEEEDTYDEILLALRDLSRYWSILEICDGVLQNARVIKS